jgi:hypothetical protein
MRHTGRTCENVFNVYVWACVCGHLCGYRAASKAACRGSAGAWRTCRRSNLRGRPSRSRSAVLREGGGGRRCATPIRPHANLMGRIWRDNPEGSPRPCGGAGAAPPPPPSWVSRPDAHAARIP